ncbi:MAG: hypothetical protein IKY08_02510, partial [Firmicutes bacterium]|nr:hypothetical protein [Bacillota bacterium]
KNAYEKSRFPLIRIEIMCYATIEIEKSRHGCEKTSAHAVKTQNGDAKIPFPGTRKPYSKL